MLPLIDSIEYLWIDSLRWLDLIDGYVGYGLVGDDNESSVLNYYLMVVMMVILDNYQPRPPWPWWSNPWPPATNGSPWWPSRASPWPSPPWPWWPRPMFLPYKSLMILAAANQPPMEMTGNNNSPNLSDEIPIGKAVVHATNVVRAITTNYWCPMVTKMVSNGDQRWWREWDFMVS